MALIIDAEMPYSCFNCPCLYREVDGRYFCRHSDGLLYPLYSPMTEGCPILGEIPDKHGRLIEAHFSYEEFKEHYKNAFGNDFDNFDLYNAFSVFNDMIVNAPTVLEVNYD